MPIVPCSSDSFIQRFWYLIRCYPVSAHKMKRNILLVMLAVLALACVTYAVDYDTTPKHTNKKSDCRSSTQKKNDRDQPTPPWGGTSLSGRFDAVADQVSSHCTALLCALCFCFTLCCFTSSAFWKKNPMFCTFSDVFIFRCESCISKHTGSSIQSLCMHRYHSDTVVV